MEYVEGPTNNTQKRETEEERMKGRGIRKTNREKKEESPQSLMDVIHHFLLYIETKKYTYLKRTFK